MSFTEFQDRLARSIRVRGLPAGYDKEEVLSNLKNAGTIEDTKLGTTEMIVIYSSANEKDLSKMYDGCPIGDYVINLEDPTSFEIDSDQTAETQNKPEELIPEPEVVHSTHHQENPVSHNDEQPVAHTSHVEHHEAPAQETVDVPRHEEPEPIRPVEENQQPAVVERSEPVYVERTVEAPVERERKAEAPVEREKKADVPVERRPEAVPTHQEPVQQKPADSAKNLLRELQNTNLPARAGVPEGDAFRLVTKRSFLLIFTMVWGLQLFLRSVF